MGDMTKPKGGDTKTTTQVSQVPAYVQDAQNNLQNAAKQTLGSYITQPAYTSASLNADQTGAYDLTRNVVQNATAGSAKQPTFDSAAYLAANPDVAASGMDALQHYSQYGKAEGRNAPMTAGTAAANAYTAPNGLNPYTYEGATYNPTSYAAQQAAATGYTASTYDPTSYAAQHAAATGYDPKLSKAEQVTGAEIQSFLQPYKSSVVDTSVAKMRREYGETQAANAAKAAKNGTFGGSRQGVQSALLDRSFGDQVAETTAKLMADGYDKATATALANVGLRQDTNKTNQTAQNTAAQFGANATNSANQFNANSDNSALQYNASAANAAGQFNSGAKNTAAQFGANAINSANQFNTNAANSALQYNAGAANAAGQFNAGSTNSANAANTTAANQTQQYNTTTGMSAANIQDALKSSDQTRQLQAIQALLGIGNAQQTTTQNNLNTPLAYLQMLSGVTPQNYGGTQTTTAPNTAASPLQSLLGAGLAIGSKFI
jgi:hypothetical protein